MTSTPDNDPLAAWPPEPPATHESTYAPIHESTYAQIKGLAAGSPFGGAPTPPARPRSATARPQGVTPASRSRPASAAPTRPASAALSRPAAPATKPRPSSAASARPTAASTAMAAARPRPQSAREANREARKAVTHNLWIRPFSAEQIAAAHGLDLLRVDGANVSPPSTAPTPREQPSAVAPRARALAPAARPLSGIAGGAPTRPDFRWELCGWAPFWRFAVYEKNVQNRPHVSRNSSGHMPAALASTVLGA